MSSNHLFLNHEIGRILANIAALEQIGKRNLRLLGADSTQSLESEPAISKAASMMIL
jgi:hypothetical protein